jgi:drug/metabolite transporter (DMT)-like permease
MSKIKGVNVVGKWIYTGIAMLAFAGNSILCRWALADSNIDPASFTVIRLVSGAVCLAGLVFIFKHKLITHSPPQNQSSPAAFSNSANPANPSVKANPLLHGSWLGALGLFTYAACFSFAYVSLNAATGALILFGSVQFTMITYSLVMGARLNLWQWLGFALAIFGLGILFLPSATTPDLLGGGLMMLAGIAWGGYSILGKKAGDPTLVTTGNFIRSSAFALVLVLFSLPYLSLDPNGVVLALLSGAIASGMGYAIWYAVLPHHPTTTSASVQLSVPVVTTVIGVIVLGEALSAPMILASCAILGGIYMVINAKHG